MAATFHKHMTLGQQHPAYWSYLTTLELIDAPVAAMDAPGCQWRRTGPSHGHVAGLGLARARRRVQPHRPDDGQTGLPAWNESDHADRAGRHHGGGPRRERRIPP